LKWKELHVRNNHMDPAGKGIEATPDHLRVVKAAGQHDRPMHPCLEFETEGTGFPHGISHRLELLTEPGELPLEKSRTRPGQRTLHPIQVLGQAPEGTPMPCQLLLPRLRLTQQGHDSLLRARGLTRLFQHPLQFPHSGRDNSIGQGFLGPVVVVHVAERNSRVLRHVGQGRGAEPLSMHERFGTIQNPDALVGDRSHLSKVTNLRDDVKHGGLNDVASCLIHPGATPQLFQHKLLYDNTLRSRASSLPPWRYITEGNTWII
jgi:hypothetical protein